MKNPLREICTVGSVRGESPMRHDGPKRARSWKRRTQPRKVYSASGLLYSAFHTGIGQRGTRVAQAHSADSNGRNTDSIIRRFTGLHGRHPGHSQHTGGRSRNKMSSCGGHIHPRQIELLGAFASGQILPSVSTACIAGCCRRLQECAGNLIFIMSPRYLSEGL